eukprot:gene10159-18826_t
MPTRCLVKGCGQVSMPREVSLFEFPTEETTRTAWADFAGVDCLSSLSRNSRVCSKHFKKECFANYAMWTNGLASRLSLLQNAIPTFFLSGHLEAPEIMDVTPTVNYQPHAREIGKKIATSFANTFNLFFTEDDLVSEKKFIVFKSCLWKLFTTCPSCNSNCTVEEKLQTGTQVSILQSCSICGYTRNWLSQPNYGHTPAGNIQLAGAIFFNGSSCSKVLRTLQSINIASISESTSYEHASRYLQPTVYHKWKCEQENLFQQLSQMEGGLVLGTDGKADSPGHSAKYGLIQKKATALSKQKGCEIIAGWIKRMSNHIYWCASTSSGGDGELILAKWLAFINHMHNIHEDHSDQFPSCEHGDLGEAGRLKKWLKPGTTPSEKAEQLIRDKHLCKNIQKLSPYHQTSNVDAFHSLILHFCPKMTPFSFKGMLCRLLLAALHYNENSDRQQATTSDGKPAFLLVLSSERYIHERFASPELSTFGFKPEARDAQRESNSNQSSEKLDKDDTSLGFDNDTSDNSVNEAVVDPDEKHGGNGNADSREGTSVNENGVENEQGLQSVSEFETDSSCWTFISLEMKRYWAVHGPKQCQNRDVSFFKSSRQYKVNDNKMKTRCFSASLLKRKLSNAE